MISYTQTIQGSTSVVSITLIDKKDRIKSLIHRLVQDLKSSGLFELQESFFDQWQQEIDCYFLQAIEKEAFENIALALHFLITEKIYPAINQFKENRGNQTKILDFEDKIKEIIQQVVPENIDEWMQDVSDEINSFIVLKNQLQDLIKTYDEIKAWVFSSANSVNQKLKENFDQLKERTFQLNAQREILSEEIQLLLDQLMPNIKTLSQQIESYAETTENLNKRMQEDERQFQNQLGQITSLL